MKRPRRARTAAPRDSYSAIADHVLTTRPDYYITLELARDALGLDLDALAELMHRRGIPDPRHPDRPHAKPSTIAARDLRRLAIEALRDQLDMAAGVSYLGR